MIKNLQADGQNRYRKGISTPMATVLALGFLIIMGGYFYIQNQWGKTENVQEIIQQIKQPILNRVTSPQELDEPIIKSMRGATTVKYSGAVLAGTSAPLLDFQKADYDVAVASDKLIVLYFYANWCPICKAEFPKMQEAFNEITHHDVVGFRVNYKDNQTDQNEQNLARQFGVAYQHTKVFLKNGKQILKAPDGWDKARYITEINKALAQ